MDLPFFKYQGTGNDFILVDNRSKKLSKNDTNLIKNLCDRKFGIGADGLILLEDTENKDVDFVMVYFNSDGRESSMCGNGGRCIVAFAQFLGIIKTKAIFMAIDGLHEATIDEEEVSLKMLDVAKVSMLDTAVFLNTGSPHHVVFTSDVDTLDVKEEGAAIRYSQHYDKRGGTNVNFATSQDSSTVKVRTYERGVEDETLSCGTGVTAVAIAAFELGQVDNTMVNLNTPGGALKVSFEKDRTGYKNVWLTGPAKLVFKGTVSCRR